MRVIGIDPGLTKTGIGIVDHSKSGVLSFVACDTIYSSAQDLISLRLHHFHDSILKLIELYKPNIAAIEETFLNKNPNSSLKLGHVRGAIILSLSLSDLPVFEYSSTAIKKSVTGQGKAPKEQVQAMVKILLPKNTFKTEDEADALATAICHINNSSFNKILNL